MRDLDHVTELVERMAEAPTFEEAARALAEWARELTGCDSVFVRARQPSAGGGEWIPVVASAGASHAFLRDEALVDGSECLCGRVATGCVDSDRPYFTDDGSFLWGRFDSIGDEFAPEVLGSIRGRCVDEGYGSLAVVPLGGRGDAPVLGCIHLAARRNDAFEGLDGLLEAAGRMAGRLLQNHKQQDSERAALETIREALLPTNPPGVAGLDLGVFSTTAEELMHVGGDFYDVLDLPSGRVALLAGDYSGKGLDAVGAAARLRMELATLGSSADDPSGFLRQANDVLPSLLSRGTFVSAICCTLEPTSGSMDVCLAGHPAPLLLRAGSVEELDAPSNLPLGVEPGRSFQSARFSLKPGDVFALYTDGVSESRNNGDLFGAEGVSQVMRREASSTPMEMARAVVSAAARHHDPSLPDDDRLVLIARVVG